jgi:hypothetical protein
MEFDDIVLCFLSLLIIISMLDYLNPMKEGATGECNLKKYPTTGEVKTLKKNVKKLTKLVGNNSKNIKKMGETLQEKSSELTGGFDPDSGDKLPSVSGM